MDEKPQTFLNMPSQQVLKTLATNEDGLSNAEATQRLQRDGRNEIVQQKLRSLILDALLRSLNPMVGILLVAAGISAFTGSITNAVIIISMVLISIGLDYFQSHRSLVASQRLNAQVATTATVKRNGAWHEIPTKELVRGDIIQLTAGDMVPADAYLLTARDLHVQQAALTGESLPVEKTASVSAPLTVENIAEAPNLVFSGSSVVSGTATAVIIATGKNTLFGEIAQSLNIAPPHTEFEKGVIRFGFFISKVIFVLVLFVFVVCTYFKYELMESLLFAIALAVGLTPEFLPMITTVTLTSGALKMARHGVIVKNLASIQNLGSIDILCSDKTGTLTSGEMSLDRHCDAFGNNDEQVMLLAYLNSLYETGIQNPLREAVIKRANVNPLDIAILKHDHPDVQPYTKLDEIPFDFERRRASVVVDKNGQPLLITKGAPEEVLSVCTHFDKDRTSQPFSQEDRDRCEKLFQSLSEQGYRVLGVAYRNMTPQAAYSTQDEQNLTFSGFLAFSDPPLADTAEVIASLLKEGVTIKILTGDNELVARHVCQQVGLDPGEIILGKQIEHLTEPALAKLAEQTRIFARVSPMQKQRIIAALRSQGHTVGYLGDGINDAPSLHIADVGISVANAVDVAREAASIILLKHQLKVLRHGILEGRKSFGNVMKYLMMGTSSNFGNVFSMAGAVVFLPFLPMLPTQILLNNLLYDLAQVTIPSDNVDPVFMRKPRHWDISIIRRFMLYIGPVSSIFDFLTFFVMLAVFHANEALFHTGWFVESLATQVLVIFIIRTAKNPFKSKPSLPLTLTVLAAVAVGVALPFTPVATLLGFVPLPSSYFLFLVVATLLYLLLVQFVKQRLMWRWLAAASAHSPRL